VTAKGSVNPTRWWSQPRGQARHRVGVVEPSRWDCRDGAMTQLRVMRVAAAPQGQVPMGASG
jgi:hypothetical protein